MADSSAEKNIEDVLGQAEFEERADYLEFDKLTSWTATSKHFDNIQKKLIQVGAKLITGPRGTGKTHQMRFAHYSCINDQAKPLSIYVSFNHYLRLETYLHENSNAISIFHSWVLAKIVLSCFDEYKVFPPECGFTDVELKSFIVDVEKQNYSKDISNIVSFLNVRAVQEYIESVMIQTNRKRAILLLDDAALTLTSDYLVEFFDIFRSLKSTRISPKASVYPGSTKYGPRFHLGQDAEKVPLWLNVSDPEYLEFMRAIINSRFNEKINIDDDMKELLMFCSFGIPRTYIMFIRSFIESDRKTIQSKFNSIIEEKCKNIIDEYKSISQKLTQFSGIIDIGESFISSILKEIKSFNYDKNQPEEKVISVGISEIDKKADRMIKFLIEAGLLFEQDEVSHGPGRKLRRFTPHISLLINDKSLIKSRGFKPTDILDILKNKKTPQPVRRKFNKLLSEIEIAALILNLPPCANCQTQRIAEGQKFCHICGSELVDGSIFKKCMAQKLLEIPLTPFQKRVIDKTQYSTIEDVISSSDTAAEFRKIRGVGRVHSERIVNKITAWANEFYTNGKK
jgi:hypothetical protein